MNNKIRKGLTIVNVCKVLHEEWNPIGCRVPEDEYESYAKVIVKLLQQKCSESLIKEYLIEVSFNMIELEPNYIAIDNTMNKFIECKWFSK